MHKVTKTVAILGLLAPLGANALGVGDIRLHSALNQSLDAEIPLVLSGADSLSDVRVSLASPETFTKAGLERHYFLTKLQFSPVQTTDGRYVIKVSSRDVMREPFLNFLVEVNSPQGRVVREFTALLDPPASMQGEAMAETEPAVMERPPRRYERVAEISRSGDYAPTARRSAQRTISATPQAPTPRPAPALPPASEDQLTNEAYGPIRRDENLWGIAKALNNDPALTHEQMVMGLYRANPQAFSRGVNSLKAGATLRMPTREFIAQLSPQQARVEYARQQGWNASRMAGVAPQLTEDEGPQSQLKLLAPSSGKAQDTGSQAGAGGKGRGDLALEVAETAKQENDELRSRLAQLEQKLSEMQQKLAIKDEEIASLQTQPRGTGTAPEPSQPAAPAPAAKPAAPQAVTPPPQAVPTPPPAQAPVVTPPPPTAPPPAVGQPIAPPPAPPASATPPKPIAPLPKPTAPPPAAAPEEENWLTNPTYLGIGAGAILLGITALLARRRRNAIIAETESILIAAERASRQASLGGAQFSAMRPVAEPMVEPIAAPKSSFLSEFTPSDFDTLGAETDEVDPISEADVYLAYGRYKQAEELIRHAISQHPDRDECKLKLLEIYHTTENRAAFENYARELKAQNKDGQPEFWSKVVEMGRELAPGSALFQSSSAPAAAPRAIEKSFDPTMGLGSLDLSDDLIDDLKRFEIEFSESSLSGDGDADADLVSLDFGDDANDLDAPSVKPGEPDRFAALDFDLASLGVDKAKPAAPAKEPPQPKPEAAPEFDNLLDFNFGGPPPKPQTPPKEAYEEPAYEEQADKTIDDILRDLTDSLKQEKREPESTPPPPEPEPSPASSELSLSGLGFDLSLFEQPSLDMAEEAKEPAIEFESEEAQEDASDLYAGLTDMDQVETKLDLAKAYADMDDEESASEILQDVLATGNDKQKAEARQLLAKMGKADAA